MKKILNCLERLPTQGEGARRADGGNENKKFFCEDEKKYIPPSALRAPSPCVGRRSKFLCLLFMIFISLPLFAAEDVYRFTSTAEQERFSVLTSQLRCLVCQNQNLAESNAPLAADLRQQVYLHIQQGESDRQIVDYLVARYGNFILYRPPFNASTVALWLGPLLFLLMAIFYLLFYIRKRRRD